MGGFAACKQALYVKVACVTQNRLVLIVLMEKTTVEVIRWGYSAWCRCKKTGTYNQIKTTLNLTRRMKNYKSVMAARVILIFQMMQAVLRFPTSTKASPCLL